MTAPKPPRSLTKPPYVGKNEATAAILAQNRCLHEHSLKHHRAVAFDRQNLFLHFVGVNEVVGEDFEPTVTWHPGNGRLHQFEHVVVIEDLLRSRPIPLLDTPLEVIHRCRQCRRHGRPDCPIVGCMSSMPIGS